MKQALTEAGYRGTEKVYVNAHGTGTPMNDSSETLAIKKALGEEQACAICRLTKNLDRRGVCPSWRDAADIPLAYE